jgi:hypothetical protein
MSGEPPTTLTFDPQTTLRTSRILSRSTATLQRLQSSPAIFRADIEKLCTQAAALRSPDNGQLDTPLVLSLRDALHIEPPGYLIEDILPAAGLAFLYGTESSGKTFLAIDLAFSVARGLPWHGHAVQQRPVIYLMAEGIAGLGKRLSAYLATYGAPDLDLITPLYFICDDIQFSSSSAGLTRLALALQDINEIPGLLIIDTLHACMWSADENSAADIGAVLGAVTWLRRTAGCTVLILHHTRKDATTYRGHSSLAGAASTMISAKKDANSFIHLTCRKQKDDEKFAPLAFLLKTIDLPNGESSCCVIPQNAPTSTKPAEDAILAHLLKAGATPSSYTDLRDLSGLQDKTFNRLRHRLIKAGLILPHPSGGYIHGSLITQGVCQ